MTVAVFNEVALQGKTLTPAQLQFFNESGYIVLKGFLSSDEVDAIQEIGRRAVQRAAAAGGSFRDGVAMYDVEPLKSDPTGKKLALRKIQELFQVEPAFRQVMASDKMLDAVEDLIGPNIYYHSSKLMCKPANGGRRKPWHQDYAYWSTMNTRQVTVWTAIDPATRANGCMQVIPGSHKRGLIPHHHLDDFQIIEDGIEKEKVVFAEMEPGDTLIFSVLTLHASDPNMSPSPRLSAIIDFDSEPAPANVRLGSRTPLRGA